jgi:hypothetical protein
MIDRNYNCPRLQKQYSKMRSINSYQNLHNKSIAIQATEPKTYTLEEYLQQEIDSEERH